MRLNNFKILFGGQLFCDFEFFSEIELENFLGALRTGFFVIDWKSLRLDDNVLIDDSFLIIIGGKLVNAMTFGSLQGTKKWLDKLKTGEANIDFEEVAKSYYSSKADELVLVNLNEKARD